MKKTDNWMPLYIADYLADTQHLTAEQHGAYILLLMQQWRAGALPKVEQSLALIAKVDLSAWRKRVWPVISTFFQDTDDGYVQGRLAAERRHAFDIAAKRAKSGRAGADAKWGKSQETGPETDDNSGSNGTQPANKTDDNEMANGMANACQNDAPRARTRPSPSQKERTSSLRSDVSAQPSEPPPAAPPAKPKRAQQVPPDWRPSDADRNFAACHIAPGDLDQQVEQFRDHHRAKGNAFRDLSAAWRTWCRNHSRWKAQRKAAPAPRQSNMAWMLPPEPDDGSPIIDQQGMTIQ